MIIFPAIDIQRGKCVRLERGDFNTAKQVAADYIDTAISFEDQGATWLHLVDLDGARTGKPHLQSVLADLTACTGLQLQVGGGIRDMETIQQYMDAGVSRVVLGSVAVTNPDLVRDAVNQFGKEAVAVSIDSRDGRVAVEGWTKSSSIKEGDLLLQMQKLGVRYFIVTDIARDGMMEGPNIDQLVDLRHLGGHDCRIIGSGGIRNMGDVSHCKSMGMYGIVCGKALYEDTLKLDMAILLGKGV